MHPIQAAILSAAVARTESQVAQAIVSGLLTPSVVLARLWLADPAQDLYLVGSAGNPTGGGAYKNLDGPFARIGQGVGKIGRVGSSREALIVTSVRGDEGWISNPGWIARQGVRAFLGFPVRDAGKVLGVLAIFERSSPTPDHIEELRFLADYTAARLADVRVRVTLPAPLGEIADTPAHRTETAAASRAPIVTRQELRALERETIANALAQTGGRVFGPHGAARLLGMKPTTLASRIKVLELRVR
jgi:transcriptional regulator with GAF, ATPase, and Fis domain